MSWRVKLVTDGVKTICHRVLVVDETGANVCEILWAERSVMLARARQIAAVPELVAVCEEARKSLAHRLEHGAVPRSEDEYLVALLEEVLAKAGGSS